MDNTPIIKKLPPAPLWDGEKSPEGTKDLSPQRGKGATALEELDLLLEDSSTTIANQSVKRNLQLNNSLY